MYDEELDNLFNLDTNDSNSTTQTNKFYWWIRVFDWVDERDRYSDYDTTDEELNSNSDVKWFNRGKGTMLDEFYIITDVEDREIVKRQLKTKYEGTKIGFAKPRRGNNGIYCIVDKSTKSWYDRFTCEIDTICLNDKCHKSIKGVASEFPRLNWNDYTDPKNFFCSHECQRSTLSRLNGEEGEWQTKEEMPDTFGYIYHIYNRKTNKHYVGQTRFAPFFRWQEHMKSGDKGSLMDCTFEVLTEVKKISNNSCDKSKNQSYLNNIEAWWIRKFIADGLDVMNSTVPKLTLEYLQEEFDNYLSSNNLSIIGSIKVEPSTKPTQQLSLKAMLGVK